MFNSPSPKKIDVLFAFCYKGCLGVKALPPNTHVNTVNYQAFTDTVYTAAMTKVPEMFQIKKPFFLHDNTPIHLGVESHLRELGLSIIRHPSRSQCLSPFDYGLDYYIKQFLAQGPTKVPFELIEQNIWNFCNHQSEAFFTQIFEDMRPRYQTVLHYPSHKISEHCRHRFTIQPNIIPLSFVPD